MYILKSKSNSYNWRQKHFGYLFHKFVILYSLIMQFKLNFSPENDGSKNNEPV